MSLWLAHVVLSQARAARECPSTVIKLGKPEAYPTKEDGRLNPFELETWDSGKLTVNRAFADLLRQHGWVTFDSIWAHTAGAAIAKKLRTDRITLRFTLEDSGVKRAFYIKRHVRSSWKEYIKPLLRLTWPILGARNEWRAILDFHDFGIPTMTPVALGESGANSFLITEAIENCTKLSDLNTAAERRGFIFRSGPQSSDP